MQPNLLLLRAAERASLVPDAGRDRHPPDVVEERSRGQPVRVHLVEPDPNGSLTRDPCDAARVTEQVRRLEVRDVAERGRDVEEARGRQRPDRPRLGVERRGMEVVRAGRREQALEVRLEGAGKLRIEDATGLLAHGIDGKSRPAERIEVGCRRRQLGDAGGQRDRVALEALRTAGAIPRLEHLVQPSLDTGRQSKALGRGTTDFAGRGRELASDASAGRELHQCDPDPGEPTAAGDRGQERREEVAWIGDVRARGGCARHEIVAVPAGRFMCEAGAADVLEQCGPIHVGDLGLGEPDAPRQRRRHQARSKRRFRAPARSRDRRRATGSRAGPPVGGPAGSQRPSQLTATAGSTWQRHARRADPRRECARSPGPRPPRDRRAAGPSGAGSASCPRPPRAQLCRCRQCVRQRGRNGWPNIVRSIGLDVGRAMAEVAIVEPGGRTRSAGRIEATPEGLRAFARTLGPDDQVVLEATTNTWAIVELLEAHAGRVVVSNPLRTRAIAEAKTKTDTIDAATLAGLLAADYLPVVWQPDPATRALRRRVAARAAVVAERTRLRNRIGAVLIRNLVTCPWSDVFGVRGRAWLAGVPLPEDERDLVEGTLRLLDAIEAEVRRADRAIARGGPRRPAGASPADHPRRRPAHGGRPRGAHRRRRTVRTPQQAGELPRPRPGGPPVGTRPAWTPVESAAPARAMSAASSSRPPMRRSGCPGRCAPSTPGWPADGGPASPSWRWPASWPSSPGTC